MPGICSVAWPVEKREGSTEHRAETEIDQRSQAKKRNNVKDGGEMLPWPWGDQIVRCKDALKQSP